MPDVLLSENTRVVISISTLIIVIGFAITGTFTFTTWKTKTESSIAAIELEIDEAKNVCATTNAAQDEEIQLLKVATVENQTNMVEIKTDIKWIRAYMEQNNGK